MALPLKEIEEFKTKYEDIYEITIGDKEGEFSYTFIYRLIGKKEYNDIMDDEVDILQSQERVCNLCILYPESDFTEGLAGIAEVLSNHIIHSSSLMQGQQVELLSNYREEMMIFDYQIDCIIHEAFPEYPIEEIGNWTIDKTMYYLSRAEYILKELRGVPLQYIPQEEAIPQEQQYQNTFHANKNDVSPSQMEDEGLKLIMENETKKGKQINTELSNVNDMMPELSWFASEENLKGEFD